ncbi:uncharacterized protein LOC106172075 [Lingula anatina]|uniref:Uncharacterized protein LOC106172075 n=1 Tax=Lingula anatina TaxID=7574 RepID=A0A1S3JD71_LINAN|nr:uncharacterized protein LOC106172075 [Lingula anatina]|eukprot:XP_013408121.1 uncharacterized protein LOC106172075 [Lingula anatina]
MAATSMGGSCLLLLGGLIVLSLLSSTESSTLGTRCYHCQFRVLVSDSFFLDPNFGNPACAYPGSRDSDVEAEECLSDRCFVRYSPTSGVITRGCFETEDGIKTSSDKVQVDRHGDRWQLCSSPDKDSTCNDLDIVASLNGHHGNCHDPSSHPTDEPYKAVNPPYSSPEEEVDLYAVIGLNRRHASRRVIINHKPVQPTQPDPIASYPTFASSSSSLQPDELQPVEPPPVKLSAVPFVSPTEQPSVDEEKDWYQMIGLDRGHGKHRSSVEKHPNPHQDVSSADPTPPPKEPVTQPQNTHSEDPEEPDWYLMVGLHRDVDVARQAAARRGSASYIGSH